MVSFIASNSHQTRLVGRNTVRVLLGVQLDQADLAAVTGRKSSRIRLSLPHPAERHRLKDLLSRKVEA